MKIKKRKDKSVEEIREIAFWKFSFKKSMERKIKKNAENKRISDFMSSISKPNHEENALIPSESDDESVSCS